VNPDSQPVPISPYPLPVMAVKERVGVVVSDKMDKTVVVAIENRAPHPKYGKIIVRTKRYKAHDENNECRAGDRVRIRETRPLSRTKRWMVVETLNQATQA
jgi:small subunit ribosomal protein S17